MNGKLTLRLDVDRFSADVMEPQRAVALAALMKIRLKRIASRYDDGGLGARLLANDPTLRKTTPQKRRADAQAALMVAMRPLTLADLPPAFAPAIEAIQAFAADPRSLDIVLIAPKGLGMAEAPLLQAPRELLKRIEVTATANR